VATWGPIQLRLKGSRQVEFDGEASPAPGGGSMPEQAIYSNSTGVDIPNGGSVNLGWATLNDGADLLDRTDPTLPTFLEDGTYALTVAIIGDAPNTPGGYSLATLFASGFQTLVAIPTPDPSQTWGASAVFKAAAGDNVGIEVENFDGAATHNYALNSAYLVKLA
jgi:hypothetical protein